MKTPALTIAILSIFIVGIYVEWNRSDSQARRFWQQSVVPGELSQSHAFLANNCAACHTPVTGVDPVLCTVCHADNKALLQRQPTAFHESIRVCSGCHVEHQGSIRMPTTMDHALFALINPEGVALRQVASETVNSDTDNFGREAEGCEGVSGCDALDFAPINQTSDYDSLPVNHPRNSDDGTILNCVGCHATKDRHQGLFGSDCAQCHGTGQWTNASFVHPSASSTECSQCHKPPPSHNMMHFSMVSAPIAKQPNAKVTECFLCHQSTSWNDIKGVGWIKHH